MIRLLLLLASAPLAVWAGNQAGLTLEPVAVRQHLARADLRTDVALLDRAQVKLDPLGDARDAILIKERLRRLYAVAGVPDGDDLALWLATLGADGSWDSFDYTTYHEHFFPPFEHLKRVQGLALAYVKPSPYTGDRDLLDAVTRAIDYWVTVNPRTRHLWYVEIGVPLFLVKPLMLLEKDLPPDLLRRAFPLLTRAVRDDAYIYNGTPATGANLTWIARTALEAALLTDNVPLAQQAAQRIADEIRANPAEGIQSDFGYYQHGTQFYAGGYGASFIHDAAAAAALLEGTRYAMMPATVALLVDYVLEGPRWMTRNGSWVAGSRGREIARPGGRMAPEAVRRLLEMADVPRRPELEAFLEVLTAPRGSLESPIQGNRHFWSVDLMAHHTPRWTAFVDLTSKRIFGTEGGNGENLLGTHLVDGVVQVMRDGGEYHNIAPLWDWKKLPGTTVRQYQEPIPVIDWWGDGTRGTTAFVGGVTDGRRGMAVLDFNRNGVRVRKIWSVSDKWILAAGAGLEVDASDGARVVTTIDQRYRRGEVIVERTDGERMSAPEGETHLEGPVWIRHDGMATYIPARQQAILRLDHRRDSWERINNGAQNPGRVEEADIYTLWLEHGASPESTFHYIVWPDVAADASLPATGELPSVRFHDAGLVVVEDAVEEVVQAAAFEAGEWSIEDGRLALSHPCVVQIRRETVAADLTVVDPTALLPQVTLDIPRGWLPERLRGYYAGSHRISLPQGAGAGNSVQVGLGIVPYVKAAAAAAARERPPFPLLDVAAGSFRMGRESADADNRLSAEIYLSPYRISEAEVTWEQWLETREWALANGYPDLPPGAPHGAHPDAPGAGSRAVTRVNWFAAARWCNALSERFGLEPVYYSDVQHTRVYREGHVHLSPAHAKAGANGYRLPTEAEWAFAVASLGPFVVGARNAVFEWCFDYYGPYPESVAVNPPGPMAGFLRVRRGGVQEHAVRDATASERSGAGIRLPEAPGAAAGNIGFRIVRRGLSLWGPGN